MTETQRVNPAAVLQQLAGEADIVSDAAASAAAARDAAIKLVRNMKPEEIAELARQRQRDWLDTHRAGVWMETASGLVLRVRRLRLLDMAEAGTIPQPLLPVAAKLYAEGGDLLQQLADFMPVINANLLQAVIEPRLLERLPTEAEAADGYVWINEIPANDRLAVWNWLNKFDQKLRSFLDTGVR
jgi:hypothetical protein